MKTVKITESTLRRIIREELTRTRAYRVIAERSTSRINSVLKKKGFSPLGSAPANISAMIKKGVHDELGMSEDEFKKFVTDYEQADN